VITVIVDEDDVGVVVVLAICADVDIGNCCVGVVLC